MTGPSKKMLVSDEVFYELLQASEYSSDSEINVKILSGGEQNVSSGVNGKVPVIMKAYGGSGQLHTQATMPLEKEP
jgi:hypothetical protein